MRLDQGIEILETQYQSPKRDKSRRLVMVRQKIKERPAAI